MLAKVHSACLVGMEGALVDVEVSLAKGMPRFSIVGLPDASVREARDRVVSAIRNSGFEFPSRRVTVNLAPAELKKEGPVFDVAIALGILMASQAFPLQQWPRCLWLGELALDGTLRAIRGALPLVRHLSQQGWSDVVLPTANLKEVSFLSEVQVFPFQTLREIVDWLQGSLDRSPVKGSSALWTADRHSATLDLVEIKGQVVAKRALEIAAAGQHHLLMIGCPGTGKSLLAQALPTLMPVWTLEEALQASQLHSVAGVLNGGGLLRQRPFRSPHHTTSSAALIGGGDTPMPGEISLAHRGVLFLDELPEFRRDALEALRQPLEEGRVHLQRVRGRAVYPSQFLLVGAMNPCPCGYRGHPKKECLCSSYRTQKYMAKLSGPLLDRIDLQVEMPVLTLEEMFSEGSIVVENSDQVRQRVEAARERQRRRFPERPVEECANAFLKGQELRKVCALGTEAKQLLKQAVERLGLSARAFDRIRRIARTMADLEGKEEIEVAHVAEAVQYRILDKQNYF